ncbi:hypothetical protein BDV96DRAFT_691250 [Lophiotrema nucula]|uniref:Uncharacterized protein n=1 Tax=Lophiotrema nucula TaxID=690887 RepID=A0A6A5YTZ3_9PLEO|nr:hypothetical protein BDV96DRAFT_691250 [Lophiotrema nucula]
MPGYQRSMTTWDVRSQLQSYEDSRQNGCCFDRALGLRSVRNFGAGARESMDERLKEELAARNAARQSKTLNVVQSGRITKQKPAAPKSDINRLTGPGQSNIAHDRAYEAGQVKARTYKAPSIKMLSQPTKGQAARDFVREEIKAGIRRAPPAPAQTRMPAIKMVSVPITKKKAGPLSAFPNFGASKPKIRQVQAMVPANRR